MAMDRECHRRMIERGFDDTDRHVLVRAKARAVLAIALVEERRHAWAQGFQILARGCTRVKLQPLDRGADGLLYFACDLSRGLWAEAGDVEIDHRMSPPCNARVRATSFS